MSNNKLTEIAYFSSFANYFWKWADSGEVIVSRFTKSTIGYREDIILLLKDISKTISPNLGSVLLVVFACTPAYKTLSYEEIKSIIKSAKDDDSISSEILEHFIIKAFKLLDRIQQLPAHLKQGQKRLLLLTEVLNTKHTTIENFNDIIDGFQTGNFDQEVFSSRKKITYSEIANDFHILSKAEHQFSSVEILQEKLETSVVGLNETDIEPKLEKDDFLQQLLKDRETAHLSDLATHLISSLKIPISLESTGDLSLGGVSDVTNKGEFDKLLLSELAYSEDVFLSRLINNEALYFKREVAPDNLTKNRIILLDTTIKTWGSPRILGLALALAFKCHPKTKINTQLYLLDGDTCVFNSLETKEDVKQTLKLLSPHLDCSKSLRDFFNADIAKKNDEVIFLVEASNYKEAAVQKALHEQKLNLDFLVTIEKNGLINYFSVYNGISKPIGNSHLNINEIVNKKRTFGRKTTASNTLNPPFVPVFFRDEPNYPILSTLVEYPNEQNLIKLPNELGYFLKNKFNELVFFPHGSKRKSGYILQSNIGNYHFEFALSNTKTEVFLLTYTIQRVAGFSIINLADFSVEYHDLKQIINNNFKNVNVTTYEEDFYVRAKNKKFKFNNRTFSLDPVDHIKIGKKKENKLNYTIGTATTTFVKITKVRISLSGDLYFNNKKLEFQKRGQEESFYLVEDYSHTTNFPKSEKTVFLATVNTQVLKKVTLLNNPKLKFRYVQFKDGSQILFDNKGFAHLKSANEHIPEITMKMNLSSPVQISVDNRLICAKRNFINDRMSLEKLKAIDFYDNFLEPFIQHILKAY